MAVYYAAENGHDSNGGTSPEAPLRGIAVVNAVLRGGDTVKFRRGDTFYGKILPPPPSEAGPTVYTSYGEGKKPVISQYKTALPSAWEKEAEGLWKLDLTDTEKFTGNVTETDVNAGFLKIAGRIYPRKKYSPAGLEKQWDFFCGDRYIYVKSEKDPAEISDDIRIACNIGCMRFADGIEVCGLSFTGSGGHGISGTVRGAKISGCEFHELGGSELKGYPVPGTRYGNGVECWSDSSDVTVENCRFSGIYDVALTMQGNKVRTGWENMAFRNNVMWNNQQCFEIWSDGGLAGTGFKNCVFENNVCLGSGYCWGYDVRPNRDCSSHLLVYGLGCPLCGVTVRNNVFSGARKAALYKSGGPAAMPPDYEIYGNTFILGPGEDLVYSPKGADGAYDRYCAMLEEKNEVYRPENHA